MTSSRRYIALLDANILASMTLTDIFVQLAVDDLFQAKWTSEIHREWMAAVLAFRPHIAPHRLERRRMQMDLKAPESLVTGYDGLISRLSLPDAHDRHVLAAAIAGRCDLIITKNLKDFPTETLAAHDITAQHPDDFLLKLLLNEPLLLCQSLRTVRLRSSKPSYSVAEYLTILAKNDLVQFTAELEYLLHLL